MRTLIKCYSLLVWLSVPMGVSAHSDAVELNFDQLYPVSSFVLISQGYKRLLGAYQMSPKLSSTQLQLAAQELLKQIVLVKDEDISSEEIAYLMKLVHLVSEYVSNQG